MNLKIIQKKLKSNITNILMLSLIVAMMVTGSCATGSRVTLRDHTICTSTGQRLTWARLNLGKQTRYSIISGKLAKQITDVTECATLKTDGLGLASWHHQKLLTWLQHREIQDSVYYQKPALTQKKCLQIR